MEIKTYEHNRADNGDPIKYYEYYVKNGFHVLHGEHKVWYPCGKLEMEKHYQHNRLHGKQIYYDNTGVIQRQFNYRNGRILGFALQEERTYNNLNPLQFQIYFVLI